MTQRQKAAKEKKREVEKVTKFDIAATRKLLAYAAAALREGATFIVDYSIVTNQGDRNKNSVVTAIDMEEGYVWTAISPKTPVSLFDFRFLTAIRILICHNDEYQKFERDLVEQYKRTVCRGETPSLFPDKAPGLPKPKREPKSLEECSLLATGISKTVCNFVQNHLNNGAVIGFKDDVGVRKIMAASKTKLVVKAPGEKSTELDVSKVVYDDLVATKYVDDVILNFISRIISLRSFEEEDASARETFLEAMGDKIESCAAIVCTELLLQLGWTFTVDPNAGYVHGSYEIVLDHPDIRLDPEMLPSGRGDSYEDAIKDATKEALDELTKQRDNFDELLAIFEEKVEECAFPVTE